MEYPDMHQLDFGFEVEPMVHPGPEQKSIKKAQSDFVFDFMDCLSSPIIVFMPFWKDAVPQQLLKHITLARLFDPPRDSRWPPRSRRWSI